MSNKNVKDNKKKTIQNKKTEETTIIISPKVEKIFCLIVALMFTILAILSFSIPELIPATLISLSIELFSISYFTKEKNGSNIRVYSLFIVGAILLIISIIYTIIHIV